MRLAVNLSKVELKKSKEGVTGKIGLSWSRIQLASATPKENMLGWLHEKTIHTNH